MMRVLRLITIALAFFWQQEGIQGFSVPHSTRRHPSAASTVKFLSPRSTASPLSFPRHLFVSTSTHHPIQDSDHQGVAENKTSIQSSNLQDQLSGNNLLQSLRNNKQKVTFSILTIAACALGVVRRRDVLQVLASLNLSGINTWLKNSLGQLNAAGNVGLACYAAMFTLWTMTVGITTPVETAAGFAFGAKRAIVVNALAKTTGALTAFFLGRFIFYQMVHARLKSNDILQLVEESIQEHPLLVALMVRLSPLPEPIKNMGMSVLDVKNRWFALSVLLHGFPFTCLWSCMGAETAKVVTLGVQPSTTLKILVSGSTWFGVIVSPSLIGWWLNSLRAKRAKRHQAEADAEEKAAESG